MNMNAMTHEAPSPLPAPIFFSSNVANSFSKKQKSFEPSLLLIYHLLFSTWKKKKKLDYWRMA
jgi:hypothetical protein